MEIRSVRSSCHHDRHPPVPPPVPWLFCGCFTVVFEDGGSWRNLKEPGSELHVLISDGAVLSVSGRAPTPREGPASTTNPRSYCRFLLSHTFSRCSRSNVTGRSPLLVFFGERSLQVGGLSIARNGRAVCNGTKKRPRRDARGLVTYGN